MMRQTVDTLTVRTRGRGFYEITREIQAPRKSLFIPLPASLDTKAWKV